MFYSGSWYRDNQKNQNILKCKLTELEKESNKMNHLIQNQTEVILQREATSACDDQAFITENQKKLKEINAQINVLRNALKKMGFALNDDVLNNNGSDDIVMKMNGSTDNDNHNNNQNKKDQLSL